MVLDGDQRITIHDKAKKLGPLAQRALSKKAWQQAKEEDLDRVLDPFCPAIELPQSAGEFEVLFVVSGPNDAWRQTLAIPLVWQQGERTGVSPPLPDALAALELGVLSWAGRENNRWHLAPRGGWKKEDFSGIEAIEVTAQSGFVPAAAALALATKYPGLKVHGSVFATGCGVVQQNRLSSADNVAKKFDGAKNLLRDLDLSPESIQFFHVASGDPAPETVESLSDRDLIGNALQPLIRAIAAEPEDGEDNEAFDSFFQLLGTNNSSQDYFFVNRVLPRLCKTIQRPLGTVGTLVTVASQTPQVPAAIVALCRPNHVILLYTAGEACRVTACKSLIQAAGRTCGFALSDSSIVPFEMGEHTARDVFRGIKKALATKEVSAPLALDMTSGSKLFSLGMFRIARLEDKLPYLEQKGFGPTLEPMKTRLTDLASVR